MALIYKAPADEGAAADTLNDLRRLARQYVTADPRRLFGPDGAVLPICDVPDDIAAAIQEVTFRDGRLQRVVLVDKAKAAELLMRLNEAADGLPIDDQEAGHGRFQN